MKNSETIKKLGLVFPPSPKPLGVYRPTLVVDRFLYVSGHGPLKNDGSLIKGKVGSDLDREEGKTAARQVGLTMLSTIINNYGNIDNIKRVVKVLGMVNAIPEFKDHPYVINGASDLIGNIFKIKGVHTRFAVGVSSLPLNASVELTSIFALK